MPVNTTVAVEDALDRWMGEAKIRQLSADTLKRTPKAIRRMMISVGASSITQVDRATMRRYLAELSDNGVRGEPLSPKSMNNYITCFNSFFEWCRAAEITPAGWANPCEGIKLARAQTKQRRALTAQEVLGLYEAAKDDERSANPARRDREGQVIVRSGTYWIMACTGIRISTAEHLRVRHLELDGAHPVVHVPAFNTGKNSRERSIDISEHDRRILLDYLEHHPRQLEADDLAFPRPHPSVLYHDAEQAKVPLVDHLGRWVGFHAFRRFHSTQLLRANVDPKLVQQRMGHRSLQTTLKHYDDVQREDQRGAAKALSDSMLENRVYIAHNPLTSTGDIANNGEVCQSQPIAKSNEPCDIDLPRLTDINRDGLSHGSSLPREDASKGMRGAEKWRTGDSNPCHETIGILGKGTVIEAVTTALRILERAMSAAEDDEDENGFHPHDEPTR